MSYSREATCTIHAVSVTTDKIRTTIDSILIVVAKYLIRNNTDVVEVSLRF